MHIDDLAKMPQLIWVTYICTQCLTEATLSSVDGSGCDDVVGTKPCNCGAVGQYKRLASDGTNHA
jgi:hypothetical protein